MVSSSPPENAETTIPHSVTCSRLANLILAPKQERQRSAVYVPRWGIQRPRVRAVTLRTSTNKAAVPGSRKRWSASSNPSSHSCRSRRSMGSVAGPPENHSARRAPRRNSPGVLPVQRRKARRKFAGSLTRLTCAHRFAFSLAAGRDRMQSRQKLGAEPTSPSLHWSL
jgi:hypothetical protein